MIFAILIVISAPALLILAYASLKPDERSVTPTKILLVGMTFAAAAAVGMSAWYLIATPKGEAKDFVRIAASVSMFLVVGPFLLAPIVNRR